MQIGFEGVSRGADVIRNSSVYESLGSNQMILPIAKYQHHGGQVILYNDMRESLDNAANAYHTQENMLPHRIDQIIISEGSNIQNNNLNCD